MRILNFSDGHTSALEPTATPIAASTIANTPSGNLAATNVQNALNELQSDIDQLDTDIDGKVSKSVLTTKGDIYVATASSTVTRQAVGSDGYLLTADSSQTNGIRWTPPSAKTVQTKTTTYTALSTDDVILCSTAGGAWVLTLFTASGNSGKQLIIKKTTPDTSILTVDPNGTETIDGSSSDFLISAQYEWIELTSDGTNWHITARNPPKTAFIKDIKATGTQGGTFTVGNQTRVLNTLTGDTSFVSLASNQFTLAAGTYDIEATCPAFQVGDHKCRLRNTTDSTNDIIGTSEYSDPGGNGHIHSSLRGRITITSAKTFEIQHQSGNTVTNNGFGRATGYASISEVYTQVTITKVG